MNISEEIVDCNVCGTRMNPLEEVKILNSYSSVNFHCQSCDYMKFPNPTWLNEAYSDVIAQTDIGLVARNLYVARKLSTLFFYFDSGKGQYLDVAGGYGLLVRLMRDRGFDFLWSDEFCSNIFAKNFTKNTNSQSFSGVTAIEVLEHVDNPIQFLENIMLDSKADYVVFTTLLYNGQPPEVKNWWYYCLDTGQHISFYSKKTLKHIARRLNYNVYSVGIFHIFSRNKLNELMLHLILGKFSFISEFFVKILMRSRLSSDLIRLKNN
jgi:hypothetical protein